MVRIVHSPWRRIGLRAVALAMLGTLAIAASAKAAEVAPQPAPLPLPPTVEVQPPEVLPPSPGPVQAPEGVVPAPVSERAPEPVIPSPPPAPAPAPVSPAPEPAPVSPAPEQAPKAPETVLIVPTPERPEHAKESGATNPGPEQTPSSTLTSSTILGTGVTAPSAETRVAPGSEPAAEVPAASTSLTGVPILGGSVGPPGSGPGSGGAAVKMTAAQRSARFSCDLSTSEGRVTNSCTSGWSGAQRLLSTPPIAVATAAALVDAASGTPGGGGHGGSAVGSPPVSPSPSPPPAPGGASGSAAGSSGLALSGFLTLAGLLLLGAPRAMRRLRLSCEPWLTACFVLIPERPG
jgi:outer membrane biosynthesis protein TonB